MILLTLDTDSLGAKLQCGEGGVIIGNHNSPVAHYKIENSGLKDQHLKIVQQGESYFVINCVNDPFAALNGLPFGKKELKNGDRLELRDHTILFQVQEEAASVFKKEESSPIDIDELLAEVEKFGSKRQKEEPTPAAVPLEKLEVKEEEPELPKKKVAAQEIEEFAEEESPKEESVPTMLEKRSSKPWQALFLVLTGVMLSLFVMGIVFYYSLADKNSQEQKKIAAGISDIAMGMTYAQFHKIVPAQQNWGNPQFLCNNVLAVLAPGIHSQAQVDAQGQFLRYPYRLRVYTSSDSKRFLVIAQPIPNILQWVISKKAIAIDSTTMQLRKMTDLKELNRLLASPQPLDGANGIQVSKLVQEGSLIALADLSGKKNIWGFSPPKQLALMHPEAETYIYNAPRYYPFGEGILERITSSPGMLGRGEVKELVERTAAFPAFVLYHSQGVREAIEVQKKLSKVTESSKFFVGYLDLNAEGYVKKSHLLVPYYGDAEIIADASEEIKTGSELRELEGSAPLSGELEFLLQENRAFTDREFEEKFYALLAEYRRVEESENVHSDSVEVQEVLQGKLVELLDQLQRIRSIQELEVAVSKGVDLFQHYVDEENETLLGAKNRFHNGVFDQLLSLLFLGEGKFDGSSVSEERAALQRILTMAWFSEKEERQYFVDEFDHISKQ